MSHFTDEQIEAIWQKARVASGAKRDYARKDPCGAWIKRDCFGKESEFGWGVDHIFPREKGGPRELLNQRPMHWKNINFKKDGYPDYRAAVDANGDRNEHHFRDERVHREVQKDLENAYPFVAGYKRRLKRLND